MGGALAGLALVPGMVGALPVTEGRVPVQWLSFQLTGRQTRPHALSPAATHMELLVL